MKKLNGLLHDVTVINFKFFLKLLNRYKKVTLSACVLALVSSLYLYFSQPIVFQKQAYFEIQTKTHERAGSVDFIAEFMDSGNASIKKPELMSLVNSYKFSKLLAETLVKSEKFATLDLSAPTDKESTAFKAMKNCTTEQCTLQSLKNILPNLFSIESEVGTNRFVVTITTRSRDTTLEVLDVFRRTLEQIRRDEVVGQIDSAINQIEQLIVTRKTELESNGGFDKVARNNLLETMLEQQRSDMMRIASELNKEKERFSYNKIRLQESNLMANTFIEGSDKLDYEKFAKLKKRSEELRSNIASVSSVSMSARSESELSILKKLNSELSQVELDLSKLGSIKRNVAFDDNFINSQINNQSNFEFDYKVAGAKLKNMQREFDLSKEKLDKLYAEKILHDNDLQGFKSDIEYLKLLESKLLTSKIRKSTIGSEVFFDAYGPEMLVFKRNSAVQIAAFSALFFSFVFFFIIVGIYLFDDRIFDAEEISKCFDDLPVLGNTPHFD